MTEKRYSGYEDEDYFNVIKDNVEDKILDDAYEIADLLNGLHEENEQLKQRINVLDDQITAQGIVIEGYQNRNQKLFDENEQLKSTIKDVVELLSEEVDLFSDKATEHDINAYVELQELDNKDAYYMATSTKKAIRMLKELEE